MEKSQLELETEGLTQRLKTLDESEQRYKDENWSLETRTHDLLAAAKESASKEQRLQQTLAVAITERNAAQRDLDDAKQAHGKLGDDYYSFRKAHDSEASNLRKSILVAETDRDSLQRKVDELTSQNQELARAMASKLRTEGNPELGELGSEPEDFSLDKLENDPSPPPSPSKGAARNSVLESETLKSSLHHAHRMIQNLKSSIHREKSEKLELKRMLQESRDELETRRHESPAVSANKRLKTKAQLDSSRRAPKLNHLGAERRSRTDVEVEDPEWEDQNGEARMESALATGGLEVNTLRSEGSDVYQTATEAEDAFETANERGTGTETEGFQTGIESLPGDSSEDLTETESGAVRKGTIKGKRISPLPPTKRTSFISTASTSDDERAQEARTPVQQAMKYKIKVGRGLRRSRVGSEEPSNSPASMKDSPASLASTRETKGRSLFAELGELEQTGSDVESDEELASSEYTPRGTKPDIQTSAPAVESRRVIDTGTMTDSSIEQERAPLSLPNEAGQGTASSTAGNLKPKSSAEAREIESALTSGQPEPEQYPMPVLDPSNIEKQDEDSIQVPENHTNQVLSFSAISSLEIVPSVASKTLHGIGSSRPSTAIHKQADSLPLNESGPSRDSLKTGVLGSVLGWAIGKKQQGSEAVDENVDERGRETDLRPHSTQSMFDAPANDSQPEIAPRNVMKGLLGSDSVHRGSQTALSSLQIDSLLSLKNSKSPALQPLQTANGQPKTDLPSPAKSPALANPASTTSSSVGRDGAAASRSIKRLGTAPSVRAVTSSDIPPLPADHREAIAAAQQVPMKEKAEVKEDSSMGPPNLPASAYRSTSKRPQTPSEQPSQTPTSATPRARYSTARSSRSRRSSVSSFESELDARFNIRADGLPIPQGLENSTDPRMIQAITQTMIGEYLWKYTRKAGRGEMSNKRHRRFFWVHPYTRTLYWSDQDPSTAGQAQLKAKSVAIEAVRVVVDDNPMPPGLHRKSLIVITPGRDVKFTATTGQQHETWFNALSYLLLRSGSDTLRADPSHLTAEDVAEFNPGFGRSAGSRISLSSYNSRTNTTRRSLVSNRAPSPSKSSVRRIPPTPHASSSSRLSQSNQASIGRRLSSYWRPSRASTTTNREGATSASNGSIYNASVVNESAEDVRQVLERQEQESDRLENVRACCDGSSILLPSC